MKRKGKEKGRRRKDEEMRLERAKVSAHARLGSNKKSNKMQFVKINRLVHKLTNSDELADKGLH